MTFAPETEPYEALVALGYTVREQDAMLVAFDADGTLAFRGCAAHVWFWLEATKQITVACDCSEDPCACSEDDIDARDAASQRHRADEAYEDHCERMGDEARGQ